jgi:transposase InsO family protein
MALLDAIKDARNSGMPLTKICEILQVDRKRIQRWNQQDCPYRKKMERKSKPYNALLEQEAQLVEEMVASKELSDASCRVLSIKAIEEHHTHISHVTFWKHMKSKNINGPRGIYANRKNKHSKPDVGEITGPNQLWSWDITHIRTTTRYVCFYLYVLLDWYSRKVVSWHLSTSLNSHEALTLWDMGLLAEKLDPSNYPKSLSDRGTQMRSVSTKLFFKSLGMQQFYARPRTPNDNPQIESFFSTLKHVPEYPGRFESIDQASDYFEKFFHWYNFEHYHTSLGMVTPNDRHTGNDLNIFKQRALIREETMLRRRLSNCAK